MSDAKSNRVGDVQERETDVAAVGLVATAANSDAVATAVLRAQRRGHQAVVTAHRPGVAGLTYADQLGAVVVQPESAEGDADTLLAQAARHVGFPGLIRQHDPSARIDFEASQAKLWDSEAFATDAALAPRIESSPGVLAAIPAFNEAASIARVVDKALEHADEVLVVDDGSSDDTVDRALGAGAEVIVHEENRGYGGALKTAFEEASRAEADHLVVLDGDGQHDPGEISDLVSAQRESGAEIVIGNRFGEGAETDLPLYRNVGLRVVNFMTNLSLGVVRPRARIGDTQSGFRAYDRRAVESLATADGIGDNMGASTDILYHANKQGFDLEEVGATVSYDVDSASSQGPVSHGLQLVQNILRTIEKERPVTVLGVPGFVAALLGLGFAYATFSNYLNTGTFPLGWALVSVFFTLAGIFACFTGIILHSLETHEY